MPTVMNMHWPEVTKEQYERARQEIGWEQDVPAGAKFHVAWFANDGFHVLDLWESPEQFQNFVTTRLRPGLERIGIQGEPKVELTVAQAVFAPNI